MIVGVTTNAPEAGATYFKYPDGLGRKLNIWVNGELYMDSLDAPNWGYTRNLDTVFFNPPLSDSDKIIIHDYSMTELMEGWVYRPVPEPSSGYDSDAEAYFDAVETAGVTLSTPDKDAYNTWVLTEKAASRYTSYTAIYPVMGGTAATHAINAKNPGTNNLTFNGSWTHNSSGADPGGTSSDYATTGIALSSMSQNNSHLSIYINENNGAGGYDFGAVPGGAGAQLAIVTRWTDDMFYAYGFGTTLSSVANTDAIGNYCVSRTASNEYRMSKNSTVTTVTEASVSVSLSASIQLGFVVTSASSKRIAFATIGGGFNSTNMQGLSTATIALQTAQGRN
jgi:hypothetical protein